MISINLFAKCPYTAENKTRMKNFLSNEERIFLSKTMLVYILDEMNKIRSNINKNIWVYPNLDSKELKNIIKKYKFTERKQIGNNLAERLDYCLRVESVNNDKVIIFGSDIPTLNHKIIECAIKDLSNYDIVIGPSLDGGYYLLGTNFYTKDIFNYRNNDLSFLIKYSKENNLSYKLLSKLKDIDIPTDLLSI